MATNRKRTVPSPTPPSRERTTRRGKPPTTPEGVENELIGLATDLTRRQLQDGTASAQQITHLLRLGSTRERLEQERLREENHPSAVDPTDTWRAFSYERSLISRHMKRVGCPPVVVLSGDVHEIALRNEYVNSGMQFVVSQNAALDRSANTRYDYWDFGPVSGGGHYSLLTIDDDGANTLTVRCRAYSVSAGGVDTNLWDTTIDLFPRIIKPAITSGNFKHLF